MHFSPDLESYVQEKITTGGFASREELTATAIQVFRELEREKSPLWAEVQARLAAAKRGESKVMDFDAFEAKLIAEFCQYGVSH